ncbi:PREDICTED: uncharacterized protein LOC105626130 [Atta cephalotes]|uniref:Uncharacterized protein n=1 Tax=Atta cephalotes TaxID=12957 RepID=A0A158NZ73_ATTCE|nr:PREDICTED: uncharacterized protein LOC105626130 [Atta cephalotes]
MFKILENISGFFPFSKSTKIKARSRKMGMCSEFSRIIFPGWKEWTYCKGIMKANNITWNKVLNEEKKPLNTQLLEFLACSKSDTIIIDYINLLKSRYFTDRNR